MERARCLVFADVFKDLVRISWLYVWVGILCIVIPDKMKQKQKA
ncbi:hypothetical protein [Dubosiella newyorkensis]